VPRPAFRGRLRTFSWQLSSRERCVTGSNAAQILCCVPDCHLDPTASDFLPHAVSAPHPNYLRDRAAEPYSARKINRALTKQIRPKAPRVLSLLCVHSVLLLATLFLKKSRKFANGVTRQPVSRIYQYGRDNLFRVRIKSDGLLRDVVPANFRTIPLGLCRQWLSLHY